TTASIYTAWERSGSGSGPLGQPISDRRCTLENGGCAQRFQGGRIHWTSSTGANVTKGAILRAWRAAGWQTGELGYPTNNERCGLENRGCAQRFEGGRIHWSPNTGAHATTGAFVDAWRQNGWQAGRLGYPTSEKRCVVEDRK